MLCVGAQSPAEGASPPDGGAGGAQAPLSRFPRAAQPAAQALAASGAAAHAPLAGSRLLGFDVGESAFFVLPPPPSADVGGDGTGGGAAQMASGESCVDVRAAREGGSGELVPGAAQASAAAAAAQVALQRSAGDAGAVVRQLETLQRVFEAASEGCDAHQPLCLECLELLCEELGTQAEDADAAAEGYEAALARLRADAAIAGAATAADSESAAEAELAELERQALDAEADADAAGRELLEARQHEKRVQEREEEYWGEFHAFQLELRAHEEERDATLASLQWAQAQLASLRGANVLNDAFHIWHRGRFGTISGFRLGRLSGAGVEWDEINAAWGQAVLCLHTMAGAVGLNFTSATLLPMGSYPKMADNKRNRYELFGPVGSVFNSNFNSAQSLFLSCLAEFAEHATARSPDFQLPYAIEGDKVGLLRRPRLPACEHLSLPKH